MSWVLTLAQWGASLQFFYLMFDYMNSSHLLASFFIKQGALGHTSQHMYSAGCGTVNAAWTNIPLWTFHVILCPRHVTPRGLQHTAVGIEMFRPALTLHEAKRKRCNPLLAFFSRIAALMQKAPGKNVKCSSASAKMQQNTHLWEVQQSTLHYQCLKQQHH